MPPEVRYAQSGDVSIAYQVVGEGPFGLVWTPGALSHLELRWETEAVARFYDLVGSTEKAVELGDRGGRELLGQHHARTRAQLSRFRGVELDTAGDRFFACFDGPARATRCACAVRDAAVVGA